MCLLTWDFRENKRRLVAELKKMIEFSLSYHYSTTKKLFRLPTTHGYSHHQNTDHNKISKKTQQQQQFCFTLVHVAHETPTTSTELGPAL